MLAACLAPGSAQELRRPGSAEWLCGWVAAWSSKGSARQFTTGRPADLLIFAQHSDFSGITQWASSLEYE